MLSALAFFALDAIGISDLSSPWLSLALIPVALVYIGELTGKIRWFRGMTLPTLLLLAASVGLLWALNATQSIMPELTYGIAAGYAFASGFLLFRMMLIEKPNHH